MMMNDYILTLLALGATVFAVTFGPMQMAIRYILRGFFGHAHMQQLQGMVRLGCAIGLGGAPGISGLIFGGDAAQTAAVLVLLMLLFTLDLAWRWLPFEWTLPLLGLALLGAWFSQGLSVALLGVLAGGGTLLILQLIFRFWRGQEAVGTGDIWLAAGLGALTGPTEISFILGLAAVTGLAHLGLSKMVVTEPSRRRLGVAYGSHMCVAYYVFLLL